MLFMNGPVGFNDCIKLQQTLLAFGLRIQETGFWLDHRQSRRL
jgi:hypothetical protein